MARPLCDQYPKAYYHVTCRANKRQKVSLAKECLDQNTAIKVKNCEVNHKIKGMLNVRI